MRSFDYIVVGGGSAGCVAAARLVGEFGARVLLLEAGGAYKGRVLTAPAGVSRIVGGTRYLTQHRTVPQDQLGGRVQVIPQAKVLGGGSSINAQAYMRGRAADYDAWGEIARTDLWSWDRILPHFIRAGCLGHAADRVGEHQRADNGRRRPRCVDHVRRRRAIAGRRLPGTAIRSKLKLWPGTNRWPATCWARFSRNHINWLIS